MRKIILAVLFLTLMASLLNAQDGLIERIRTYGGKNADGLIALLDEKHDERLEAIEFILENSSPFDLAVLTPELLLENVDFALKSRELPYTKDIPGDIFKHFVLPMRISQEPLVSWREQLYSELEPQVREAESLEEAMMIVSLWCAENVYFEPTSGRDQTPLTTMKRLFGRCEEIMILEIAAARSVGIPMRPVSAPYWNFMDNNHAWNEMWTTGGWKYLGPNGPTNNSADTWYSTRAGRSILILSHAFGKYESPELLEYDSHESLLNTTSTYGETIDYTIHVYDKDHEPVEEAEIIFYALSYGGLFPMLSLETDTDGILRVSLGRGSSFLTASKDDLLGWTMLNSFENGEEIEITLGTDHKIDGEFSFRFPAEPVTQSEPSEPILENWKMRNELSNLRREKKLADHRMRLREFLMFFDPAPEADESVDSYAERRDDFLAQCERLAGATDQFLKVYGASQSDSLKIDVLNHMMLSWNIKDLIEIPDSSSLQSIVEIFSENRDRYNVPDSVWFEHVVAPIFSSKPVPEDNWQPALYDRIKTLHRPEIMQTVEALHDWMNQSIVSDTTLTNQYFAGSLEPLQILDMRSISKRSQIFLFMYSLKYLGVPVRWKGHLEVWNGTAFQQYDLFEESDKQTELTPRTITVNVFADGKQVKAEPFGNFLLCSVSESGGMYYSYFDEEADSLSCKITWYPEAETIYNLQGYVRNENGDALLAIRDLSDETETDVALNLSAPSDMYDVSEEWDDDVVEEIIRIAEDAPAEGYRIVFLRSRENTEPEIRMLQEFESKSKILADKGIGFILYSEQGNREKAPEFVIHTKSKKFLNIEISDYPALFLVNDKNQIVFSSKGYRLGVSDLIIRKCK